MSFTLTLRAVLYARCSLSLSTDSTFSTLSTFSAYRSLMLLIGPGKSKARPRWHQAHEGEVGAASFVNACVSTSAASLPQSMRGRTVPFLPRYNTLGHFFHLLLLVT